MKRKDLVLIVLIAIVAGIFSLVVSRVVIKTGKHNLQAQVVQPISTDFQKPDENVFNDSAVNPTQLIQIGNNSNKQPF